MMAPHTIRSDQKKSLSRASKAIQISIWTAEGVKKELLFNQAHITVGRAKDNDIVLKDAYVSRTHVDITVHNDDTYELKAINDYNGIVKGLHRFSNIILRAGEEFRIGKTIVRISPQTADHVTEHPLLSAKVTDIPPALDSTPSELNAVSQADDHWDGIPTYKAGDDDDDEDTDQDNWPAYSLKTKLLDTNLESSGLDKRQWEVMRYKDERIYDCTPLKRNQTQRLNQGQGPTIQVTRHNTLRIKMTSDLMVSTSSSSQKFVSAFEVYGHTGKRWLDIAQDSLTVMHDGIYYHIRAVAPIPFDLPRERRSIDQNNIYIAGYSTWFHIAAVVMLSFISPQLTPSNPAQLAQDDVNRFALIALEQMQQQPKPKQPKPQPPAEKPIIEKQKPVQVVNKQRKPQQNFKVAARPTTRAQEIPDVTQVGALGKLGGKGLFSKTASSSHQLMAAASNVSAVKAYGGVQTFSVSGNIAALPGKEVRMARISSIGTTGGTPQGDGFGAATVGVKRKHQVKGLIVDISPPPMEVAITGGGLTREEIARVVAQHVSAIRYCYEKSLLEDPSLAGKIVSKWTINAAGLVSESGIRSSTIRNSNVHRCLVGEIQTWQFPKPRNRGTVLVSYPFVFNNAAF